MININKNKIQTKKIFLCCSHKKLNRISYPNLNNSNNDCKRFKQKFDQYDENILSFSRT